MSRICVKGLGKNTNEKQLRELFSARGEVTDVKLARKADGSTRKFAFIGFRTELQAEEAVRYYNNSFIGLSRIAVELAKKLNDTALQEKKTQHAKKSTEKVKELKARLTQVDEKLTEKKEAPQPDAKAADPKQLGKNKAEFLELSRGKNRNLTWANDDLATHHSDQINTTTATVPATSTRPAPKATASDDSDAAGSDSDDSAIDLTALIDKQKRHIATTNEDGVEVQTVKADGVSKSVSDLDYLRSKVSRFSDSEFSDSDEESDRAAPAPVTAQTAADSDVDAGYESEGVADVDHTTSAEAPEGEDEMEGEQDEDDDKDDSRLFVKNIPFSTTEDELRQLFAKYGNITEVHIPLDKERKGKGIAYVHFLFPQDAEKAQQDLHGTSFQGRVVYINSATKFKPSENHDLLADVRNSKLSKFQLKKEEERRKSLQKKESWNAAFVRSDAVLDSLAERYQVDKSSIMDTSLKGGDMAIRMAIGETQIIQENKDYLAARGVDLNAMESINSSNKAVQRSTTTLLVKNLPPETEVEELESMFAKFGVLSSFVVPPSKTMALLDFVQSQDARNAFKNLAYRRYKNSPLYLEWAPLGTFAEGAKNSKPKSGKAGFDEKKEAGDGSKGEDDDNLDDFSTLFIKNLNFSTTDDALRDHLVRMGAEGLRTVHIQKKQKGSAMLSQGFGFAEFKSAAYAQFALNKINNTVLDSYKLEIKPSEKRLTQAPTKLAKKQMQGSANPSNSCKLIVRNVAFQATKSEIRQLFTAFGSVKKVRIPKKMGGNHRGFAFVDFSTAQEAANAMTALKSTHLYGRHLVIEWAKEGEDDDDEDDEVPDLVNKGVEASRKRAQNDQRNLNITQQKAKRQKANIDDDEAGTGDVKEYI